MPSLQLVIDASKAKAGAVEFNNAAGTISASAQAAGSAAHRLQGEVDRLGRAMSPASKSSDALSASKQRLASASDTLTRATAAEAAATQRMTEADKRATDAKKNLTGATNSASSSLDRMTNALKGVIAGLTLALAVRQTYAAIVQFDTGLTNVAKTTGLAGRELSQFAGDIESLSKTLPVSTTELLEISAAAGQLGVEGRSNLTAFAETIARLGRSTTLNGENAALVLARILNVTNESYESINRLGSVISKMDTSFAVTAEEVANTARQVALATSAFRINSTEVVGLGTALASLGVRAELSGFAVGKAVRAIDRSIREGGAAAADLAKVTGVDPDKFAEIFGQNAIRGLELFLTGLGRLSREGSSANEVLLRFGLYGEEINRVLPSLGANSQLLTRTLELARKEAEEVTTLARVSDRAFDTITNQMQLAENAASQFARDLGGGLGPALVGTADALRYILDPAADVSRSVKVTATAVEGLVVTFLALGALKVGAYFFSIAEGAGTAAAAIRTLWLVIAANPVAAIVIGIGALTTALLAANAAMEDETKGLNDLGEAARVAAVNIQSLAEARTRLTRAEELGDVNKQTDAIRSQIALLEQYSVALRSGAEFVPTTDIAARLPANSKENFRLANQRTVAEYFRNLKSNGLSDNAALQQSLRDPRFSLSGISQTVVSQLPKEGAVAVIEAEIKRLTESLTELDKQAVSVSGTEFLSDDQVEAIQRAKESVDEFVESLRFELEQVGRSTREQQAAENVRKALALATKAQITDTEELTGVVREYTNQIYDQKEAIDLVATAEKNKQDALKYLDEQIDKYARETDLLRENEEVREILNVTREAERRLVEAGVTGYRSQVDLLQQEVSAYYNLKDALEQEAKARKEAESVREKELQDKATALERSGELLRRLQLEGELIGKTNNARKRAVELAKLEEELRAAGVSGTEEILKTVEAEYGRLRVLYDIADAGEAAGQAIGGAFAGVVLQAETLNDALRQVYETMVRLALDTLVTAPLKGFLSAAAVQLGSGLYSGGGSSANFGSTTNPYTAIQVATGGVFNRGITRFGSGDVVGSSTFFRYDGGRRMGEMGEDGPEGIFPLVRTPSGDLGVQAVGGGGQKAPNVYRMSWNITTPNPDGFRSSRKQMQRQMLAGVSRTRR